MCVSKFWQMVALYTGILGRLQCSVTNFSDAAGLPSFLGSA